jgi:hypothetical protein
MPHPVVFRPRGGVVLAVLAVVLCFAVLVSLAVTDGVAGVLAWGWPVVAFAWLVWLVYVRPSVTVTEGFVEVRNILRTHRVPWGDVDSVDSRFALTVRTRDGKVIRAWAAPAPGARQALTTRREEVSRVPGDGETRRPSDAEGTESGDATTLVRRALERHRREGGPALPGGTRTQWSWVSAAVTAVLLVAAVVSLAVGAAHS